ncbi:MAG: DUF2927 domain-containing protein [Alphaproteobacteria bacterium]|jgi:hypothetical protein|nr:DUF2927 domain-containing protein [Alphaproteobacteria bacterium]MBT4085235.1 DUF2927 domain-containing protein [Alphaproteobacteria bacterium]MBT4544951.1 DUF2927 domain-containing protein [Alphaproteobacteria bacterium]MBT7746168.1 DUF2927 domain-containing protein [Alphaproteobacteria bacterium]
MNVIKFSTLLVALLMTAFVSNDVQARDPLTVEKFVEYFDQIAFRNEYSSTRTPHFLRKWPGKEIKFKIGGLKKPAERFRSVIAKHSKSLSRYGAPKFVEIGGQVPGEDLIFMFARANSMKKAGRLLEKNETVLRDMAKGRCYFLTYHMPDGKLVKAMIVVNSELPDINIRHCLLEEMAQSLGLPNDSPYVSPSLFNDREERQDLSQIDKVLIRTLYDKRMKAGMPREEALQTAHKIISRLMGKASKK